MYIVHCRISTMYNVHSRISTMYNVHYIVEFLLCTLYIVEILLYTLYIVEFLILRCSYFTEINRNVYGKSLFSSLIYRSKFLPKFSEERNEEK